MRKKRRKLAKSRKRPVPQSRAKSASPSAELLEMIAMRHVPQALYVAAKLSIADLLAKSPQTADELAHATQTHADTLSRVLRTLVGAGVLAEDKSGRLRLTSVGGALRSDVPNSVSAFSILVNGEVELEGRLLDCVRTGKTAVELASGTTNWIEYYRQDPQRAATFNKAMTALSNAHYAGVVDAYNFRSIHRLVDVGGGHGRLLSLILTANPKIHGVLFDMPHAAEGGEATISAANLDSRCEVVSGDFFESVPPGGDAYILSRVIHDWDDAKSVAILKVIRKALHPKGKLLLFETMIRSRERLSYPLLSDINMILRTGGRERTEPEYRALYKAAGFQLSRAIATKSPTGMTIIEGKPV